MSWYLINILVTYMKKFGKKLFSSKMVDFSSCILLLLTRVLNPQGWCPSQPAPFCTHTLQQKCRDLMGKRGLLNFTKVMFFLWSFSCLLLLHPEPGCGTVAESSFPCRAAICHHLENLPSRQEFGEMIWVWQCFFLPWQLISLLHNFYKRFSGQWKAAA